MHQLTGRTLCVLWLLSAFLLLSNGVGWAGAKDSETLLGLIEKGEAFYLQKDYRAAAAEFEKALELRPSNSNIKRALVDIYYVQRDFKRALKIQLEIVDADPTEEDYYNLGVLYNQLGDDRKKVDAFFEAATLYGSAKSWNELAKAYTHVGDYKGAVYAYRKTVGINPENIEARYHLIRNLCRVGDYEGAAREVWKQFDNKVGAFVFFFLKGFLPALFMVGASVLLSMTSAFSRFFCSPAHSVSEGVRLSGKILLVLSIVYVYRHFAQNPFSPDYAERVMTSMYLYRNPSRLDLGTALVILFSLVAIPAYFMKIDKIPIAALFSLRSRFATAIRNLLVGFLMLSVPLALLITFGAVLYLKQPEQLSQRTVMRPSLTLFVILYLCIIAPLTEEFCFRGWLYNALKRHFKVSWSILLSALFFLMIHPSWDYSSVPVTIGLGIVSAFVMEKTRILWPSFILHAALNSFYVFVWKI